MIMTEGDLVTDIKEIYLVDKLTSIKAVSFTAYINDSYLWVSLINSPMHTHCFFLFVFVWIYLTWRLAGINTSLTDSNYYTITLLTVSYSNFWRLNLKTDLIENEVIN